MYIMEQFCKAWRASQIYVVVILFWKYKRELESVNFKRRTLAAKTCEKISSFHRLLITTVWEPPQHLLQCKARGDIFFQAVSRPKEHYMHNHACMRMIVLFLPSQTVKRSKQLWKGPKYTEVVQYVDQDMLLHAQIAAGSVPSFSYGRQWVARNIKYRLGTWICRPLKVDENKTWNPLYLCTNNGVWAALQWPTPPPLLFANPWLPPHRMKGSERCPKAFCLQMAEAVCRIMATSWCLIECVLKSTNWDERLQTEANMKHLCIHKDYGTCGKAHTFATKSLFAEGAQRI